MLNKTGPNIEPWGTLEVIFSKILYDDSILVFLYSILKLILYWLYVTVVSHTRFKLNLHSIVYG